MKGLILLVFMLLTPLTFAGVDAKQFDNPEQEDIYNGLIDELRCLVCQNQAIADSNADLAKDLRRQVYEMIQEGKSKEQITDYMLQRYGDFVLYNPPLKTKTALLWIGPFIFLLVGITTVVIYTRRRKNQHMPKLSADQQQKMHDLLEKEDDK